MFYHLLMATGILTPYTPENWHFAHYNGGGWKMIVLGNGWFWGSMLIFQSVSLGQSWNHHPKSAFLIPWPTTSNDPAMVLSALWWWHSVLGQTRWQRARHPGIQNRSHAPRDLTPKHQWWKSDTSFYNLSCWWLILRFYDLWNRYKSTLS